MLLSIDVAPVDKTVSAGSPATFVCAANGTSTEIKWDYNGEIFANDSANVTSRVDSAQVWSELKIQSPASNGSVICIVRQSFDGTILLNNNDFTNNILEQIRNLTAELIITPITPMTTPTTSPPMPTTTTGMYNCKGVDCTT